MPSLAHFLALCVGTHGTRHSGRAWRMDRVGSTDRPVVLPWLSRGPARLLGRLGRRGRGRAKEQARKSPLASVVSRSGGNSPGTLRTLPPRLLHTLDASCCLKSYCGGYKRPWHNWIARRPPEPKVTGSNPVGRTLVKTTFSLWRWSRGWSPGFNLPPTNHSSDFGLTRREQAEAWTPTNGQQLRCAASSLVSHPV